MFTEKEREKETETETESQITPLYHLEQQCSSQSCRPSNKNLSARPKKPFELFVNIVQEIPKQYRLSPSLLVVFKMLMLKIACTLDRIVRGNGTFKAKYLVLNSLLNPKTSTDNLILLLHEA